MFSLSKNSKELEAFQDIQFGKLYKPAKSECHLSLSNLIDLANMMGNQQFMNFYLNTTIVNGIKKEYKLQHMPIRIEDITMENQVILIIFEH